MVTSTLDVLGTITGYKEVAENMKQVATGAVWKDVLVVPGTIGLLSDTAAVPELDGKPRYLTITTADDKFTLCKQTRPVTLDR
jgi:hypothetical protein